MYFEAGCLAVDPAGLHQFSQTIFKGTVLPGLLLEQDSEMLQRDILRWQKTEFSQDLLASLREIQEIQKRQEVVIEGVLFFSVDCVRMVPDCDAAQEKIHALGSPSQFASLVHLW